MSHLHRLTLFAWRMAAGLVALGVVLLGGAAHAAYYTATANASTAAAYPWIDISATGTSVTTGDDVVSGAISLGFTFNFGGTNYTTVKVSSNGMLQFGGTDAAYVSAALPLDGTGSKPNIDAVMLPLWDDLFPNSGQVRYSLQGTAPNRVFIVSWNAVPYYCSSGSGCSSGWQTTSAKASFQVQIYEQGQFVYRYGSTDGSGGAHGTSIGYSNPNGASIGVEVNNTDYVQYSIDTASVPSGTAILWSVSNNLLLEYLFNEASWAGVSGEVKDTSGKGYNGTAASLAATKPTTAAASPAVGTTVGTCAYGVFNRANKDYVALPSGFPKLGTTSSFTITAWIRTTDNTQPGQRILIDDENNTGGYGLSLGDGGTGMVRFFSRGTPSALILDTPAVINNNTWYFVAAEVDLSTQTKYIYVYSATGTLLSTVSATYTETSFGSDTGLASAGGETNSAGENSSSFGFDGNIDDVRVYTAALSTTQLNAVRQLSATCPSYLNHLEIRHATGSGLTCTPSTLTVVACQDAACSTLYTGGVTGTLTATGTGMTVNWPTSASFSIPAGGTTTDDIQVTTPGSVLLGTSSVSPTASASTTCNFGSPICTFTAADSGFIYDVPDHLSNQTQTVSVSAVQKSPTTHTCVPAFASQTKALTFKCSYTNPGTGTLPVSLTATAGGTTTTKSLNSSNSSSAQCDTTGQVLNLAFNSSGVASMSLQYPDVGQMQLNASYTGTAATSESGLSMTGTDSFVAAPFSFTVATSRISPATRYVAGSPFNVTVTANNSTGAATPNFGKETTPATAVLSFNRVAPVGTGTSGGSFSGTLGGFSAGVASSSNAYWTEVGTGDITATLSNYLSSGLGATGTTGSTGAVGRFYPHHFDVSVTPACTTGTNSYTYSAQPFAVQVTAKNALGNTTSNYMGSYAQPVSLSALSAGSAVTSGSFGSTGSIAATQFSSGTTSGLKPTFTFTNKLTAPITPMTVRAVDSDGITSSSTAGGTEGSTRMRSGRLRLFNAFGSEKSTLDMAVQAQYWSGSSWVINSDDTACTTLLSDAVARSNYLDNKGVSTTNWVSAPPGTVTTAISLTSGVGKLTLAAPTPSGSGSSSTLTGSVDIALNLGSASSQDVSCVSGTHPTTNGAGLAWLRSQNGSCAATYDRDPSARASFGLYTPESRKTVHVREIF